MSNWTPTSAAAFAVYAAGFEYDPEQQIIYSRMDALQRQFGYAYGYDKVALLTMNAAIDCEPIFFEYKNKVWMIELWKGQYGLETGCEIGIYNRDPNNNPIHYEILDKTIGARSYDSNPHHGLFFDCAKEDEMLDMSYTLYRDDKPLFTRADKHWWLTGFKWGVFSDAAKLRMDINIKFDDPDMQAAFVGAIKSMNYSCDESGKSVHFVFSSPSSQNHQPRFDDRDLLNDVADTNKKIVQTYTDLHLPDNDPNNLTLDNWNTVKAFTLGYDTFFRNVLDVSIAEIKEWATALLGLLHSIFTMDFSCSVEIINDTSDYVLSLIESGTSHGSYVMPPSGDIRPHHGVGRMCIKDNVGVHGAEGWVKYQLIDASGNKEIITFKFGCPTGVYDNYVDISPENTRIVFYSKSGDDPWQNPNKAVTGGHPFYVRIGLS